MSAEGPLDQGDAARLFQATCHQLPSEAGGPQHVHRQPTGAGQAERGPVEARHVLADHVRFQVEAFTDRPGLRAWSAPGSRGMSCTEKRSSPTALTVRLTPSTRDRALLDEQRGQLRVSPNSSTTEPPSRPRSEAASTRRRGRDQVPAQAVREAQRPLQVHPGARSSPSVVRRSVSGSVDPEPVAVPLARRSGRPRRRRWTRPGANSLAPSAVRIQRVVMGPGRTRSTVPTSCTRPVNMLGRAYKALRANPP